MEDWKLQVSYKTPGGDMINVRANTADELSVLLEGIGDYSIQIASVQRLVAAAYNAAPLSTPNSTPNTAPALSSPPSSATPPSSGPTCIHGPRVFKSGSKNGKAWSGWMCPAPKGTPDQCPPAWN